MKRLAKSVSATLCASILCSSVLCYSAFTAFAEDTTTAETTASTEASTAVSEDVSYKKITVTDSNDLFTVSEDGEHLTAKKTGYYAICCRDEENGYYRLNDSGNEPTYSDSFENALVFEKVSEGDMLSCNIYFNCVVAFSSDGETVDKVYEFDAKEYVPEEIKAPTVQYDFNDSDSQVVGTFTLTAGNGVLQSASLAIQDSETGEFTWFDDIDSFEAGKESETITYTFYDNGRYKLTVYDSYESCYELSFTVDSISSVINNDNKFADLIPPEVSISMEDKKGLNSGEPFYITVTTNEDCNISVANQVTSNTRKATGYVLENGIYEIVATDKWNNTTTKEITVTAFEDGSMPEDRANEYGNDNDNILAVSNRESFWEDAANGKISGVSSSNGSTSLSTLPQTGGFKVACVVLSSGIAIAGGAFVLKKNGFKFKSREGKGDK